MRLYALFGARLSEAGALAVASVIVGVSTRVYLGFYEYFGDRANW